MKKFKAKGNVYEKLSDIIQAAGKAMGLDGTSKHFSSDVLRIVLSGPDQPHLTLVDLPGLFHAGSKTQSDNDAVAVTALVTSYMAKARSVILAVVSAKNDVNNQIVIKHSKTYDPDGSRTLGIITKPDTLPKSSDSERQFFDLAQNRDVHFKHGWHVLKNREWEQRNCSNEQRDASEREFFSEGIWASMSPSHRGIDALRTRLSSVLQTQIMNELPGLIGDVESNMKECQDILERLGASRGTLREQRLHLHSVSDTFTTIIKDAVEGKYGARYFNDRDTKIGYSKRVRAIVSNMLEDFANDVWRYGHKYEITEAEETLDSKKYPLLITKTHRLDQIKDLVKRGRGKELSTIVKEDTVTALFREQCSPWVDLIHDSANEIFESVKSSIMLALKASCDTSTRDGVLSCIVNPALSNIRIEFDAAVEKVLSPHIDGHPSTCNHYLSDNLQNVRHDQHRPQLAGKLSTYFGQDPLKPNPMTGMTQVNLLNLLNHLVKDENEADMTIFACQEALQTMEAYYKVSGSPCIMTLLTGFQVALKQFVDDYAIFAVERDLLSKLELIFTPTIVLGLEDELLQEIAGETEESKLERTQAMQKLAALERALDMLKRLDHGERKSMYQPFDVLLEEVQQLTLSNRAEESLRSSNILLTTSGEPVAFTAQDVSNAKPMSDTCEKDSSSSSTSILQDTQKSFSFASKKKCKALRGAVSRDIQKACDEVIKTSLRSPSGIDELRCWHPDLDEVLLDTFDLVLEKYGLGGDKNYLSILHRGYHALYRARQLFIIYENDPEATKLVVGCSDMLVIRILKP